MANLISSFKFRIYPNKEQAKLFDKTFGCCRFVYNYFLNVKIEAYKKDKTSLSIFKLITELTKLKCNPNFWWLSEVSITALQQSIKDIDLAYKNFFRTKKGFPKFKSKKDCKQVFRYYYPKVDFDGNKVSVPKAGYIKVKGLRKFSGKITSATISKTKTNKYHISILVDNGVLLPIKPVITSNTTIGIDLGISSFITVSNGRKVENPKFLYSYKDRLAVLQRRAFNKVKGSNNRNKANLKVAKCYEKINNLRPDFLHKLSFSLTHDNQVGTIVVEDLGVNNMVKNHSLARAIYDASWSEFTRQLQYKCDRYGLNFIKVNPAYTSKTCNNCGWVNKDLKLSDRTWTCGICNISLDRDLNASINIKNSGLGKPVELVEMPSNNIGSMKQEPCIYNGGSRKGYFWSQGFYNYCKERRN